VDVGDWLKNLGLNQYAEPFSANHIDAETLRSLTAEDLKDLGVTSVGHRRRLLDAIADLARSEEGIGFARSAGPAVRSPQTYTPQHLAERILRSRGEVEGERKRVTVLFADICGSTQITENLDPEDAAELLRPALQGMIDAVHQYEGTVNKVQGDGIMALFGAPIAHEDHAVRACYAALALQEKMRRVTEESRRSHGVEIQARVGMHCGEVLVRGIGNDLTMDYDAVGPTVHLASRMEEVAVPGGIRITPEVLRLAEGFVAVEALGPFPVKGLTEPVEVFSLTGAGPARTRLEAAAIRGFSPFVGRKEELEVLAQALSEAETGRGQTVAVSGEPGVGKSRLCQEFLGSHRTKGWLTLVASGTASSETVPWSLATRLLRTYFSIRDDDGKRQINERVLGKSMALDPKLKDKMAAILALFGVEGGDGEWAQLNAPQRRRAILEGLKTLLARESQEQPLILVLEDLHWADSESLAFLDEFLSGVTTLRTLVLANFRPEFTHTWANRPSFRQLALTPLPEETAEDLSICGRSWTVGI
jgi:class 3 adenylate cyclase